MIFVLPAGMPGPKEVEHRAEQAARILTARGLKIRPDPMQTQFQVQMLVRALVHAGVVTEAQLEYFFALARMEALESLVIESTPKPRILVPGRDS